MNPSCIKRLIQEEIISCKCGDNNYRSFRNIWLLKMFHHSILTQYNASNTHGVLKIVRPWVLGMNVITVMRFWYQTKKIHWNNTDLAHVSLVSILFNYSPIEGKLYNFEWTTLADVMVRAKSACPVSSSTFSNTTLPFTKFNGTIPMPIPKTFHSHLTFLVLSFLVFLLIMSFSSLVMNSSKGRYDLDAKFLFFLFFCLLL